MADFAIPDVRRQYPQYNHLGDEELAARLTAKGHRVLGAGPSPAPTAGAAQVGPPAPVPPELPRVESPPALSQHPALQADLRDLDPTGLARRLTDLGGAWSPQEVRDVALPVAGGLAGAAAGTVGGPAGVMVGESAGTMLGTTAGALLGGRVPSEGEMLTAAVGGPAGRVLGAGLGAATKALGRRLPGAAVPLQAQATETAQGLSAGLRPGTPSSVLYDALEQVNPAIATPRFQDAIARLRQQQTAAGALNQPGLDRILGALDESLASGAPSPFQTLRAQDRALSDKIGAAATGGGEELGAWKLLQKALREDLEAAPGSAGAPHVADLLKGANTAFKRELAAERLDELVQTAVQRQAGTDDLFLDAKGLRKAVETDDLFARALSAPERQEILDTLSVLNKVPRLRASGDYGSGRVAPLMAAGGAATGFLLGDGPGAAAMGAAAGGYLPRAVASLVSTDAGRRAILAADQAGATLDWPTLARLAIATGAVTGAAIRQPRERRGR